METKTKLGHEPAYPCEVGFENGVMQQSHQNGNTTALFNGMTIRQKLGSDVLCALLQKSKYSTSNKIAMEIVIKEALSITDTFLKLESE